MGIWNWIYVSGLLSFTVVFCFHLFLGIFDSIKSGKKLLAVISLFCLILILIGLIGSTPRM